MVDLKRLYTLIQWLSDNYVCHCAIPYYIDLVEANRCHRVLGGAKPWTLTVLGSANKVNGRWTSSTMFIPIYIST